MAFALALFFTLLPALLIAIPVFVLLRLLLRSLLGIPRPRPRAPKPAPDCALPSRPSPALATLDASTKGGSFTAPSVTLAAGARIDLDSSLMVEATLGDLVVDGQIFAALGSPGTPPVDITLVSRAGKVVIGANAVVSGVGSNGLDAVDTGAYARAFSDAGGNGGIIKISGVNVRIEGRVTGMMGGWGGFADATGSGIGPIGGRAIAVAGEGGAGGDVVICAIDSIGILGLVEGGAGGWSRRAVAAADNGSLAYAELGDAGPGGDVWLRGPAAGNCQVFFQGGRAIGGAGGIGGIVAQAVGGNDAARVRPDRGGDAVAIGGRGGDGATVKFDGTVVIQIGTILGARGGNGGDADATGGTGGNAGWFFGPAPGGGALARGGDGSEVGDLPVIPLPTATTRGGLSVPGGNTSESGGSATVKAGSGGNGNFGFLVGAPSGSGVAQGGANGTGVTPAPVNVAVTPGAPAAGGTPGLGGLGAGPVTAPGQP